VIALVVIGPKELPAVLRTVGQWMGKIRRMAAEFQGQFQEAMREAEMADLKKSIDAITDATRGIGSGFDPLSSVTKNIEGAFQEKPSETPATPAAAGEPAGTAAPAPAPTTEPLVAAEPPVTIEPAVPMESASAPPVHEPAGHSEAVAPAPTPPPANDAGGRAA
jgi:sec-independent protein translocase protein TatB